MFGNDVRILKRFSGADFLGSALTSDRLHLAHVQTNISLSLHTRNGPSSPDSASSKCSLIRLPFALLLTTVSS